MDLSDFITNHGKRVRKESFIRLVQVSNTDGKIDNQELELLHKEGKKFGLTDPEIDKLIRSVKDHSYTPPYSLHDKFEHLYQVAQMILADDVVKESEKKIIRRFALEAGFTDRTIDKLLNLLLEGIKNNKSEEELFQEFRKKHLLKD